MPLKWCSARSSLQKCQQASYPPSLCQECWWVEQVLFPSHPGDSPTFLLCYTKKTKNQEDWFLCMGTFWTTVCCFLLPSSFMEGVLTAFKHNLLLHIAIIYLYISYVSYSFEAPRKQGPNLSQPCTLLSNLWPSNQTKPLIFCGTLYTLLDGSQSSMWYLDMQ